MTSAGYLRIEERELEAGKLVHDGLAKATYGATVRNPMSSYIESPITED